MKNYLERDLENSVEQLKKLESKVKRFPSGKIIRKKIGKYYSYYLRESGTDKLKYLPRSRKEYIETMLMKGTIEKEIIRLKSNIKVLEKATAKYRAAEQGETRIQTRSDFMKSGLLHNTLAGIKVRSKDEAAIADRLYLHDISFTYEEPLNLISSKGKTIVYRPEFSFRTPTKERIVWEHFGMMADAGYRSNAYEKLTDYFYNDYIAGSNLIITMEYKGGNVDMTAVDMIIAGFLKPLLAN